MRKVGFNTKGKGTTLGNMTSVRSLKGRHMGVACGDGTNRIRGKVYFRSHPAMHSRTKAFF